MSERRIAIVDDELEILTMLEKFLNKKGYKVTTYANPLHAVEQISAKNCDLVLLDIMMPQLDGISALERIKQKEPSMKVLMMTAHSTLDRVLKSHKIGANDFILKPFSSLNAIEEKIKILL